VDGRQTDVRLDDNLVVLGSAAADDSVDRDD
jgi:hypothetical protein